MVVTPYPGSSGRRCHEAPHEGAGERRPTMASRWSDGRRRPPALLGAERLSVPDGLRRARPKGGPIIPPRRLPALHPLAPRGKEKGEGRARVHKNRAGGALAESDRKETARFCTPEICRHQFSGTGAPAITSKMRARVLAVVSFGSWSRAKNPCAMISPFGSGPPAGRTQR